MKFIPRFLLSLLVLLGLTLAPALAATGITDAEVRTFVKAGDQALSVHNIGKVVSQMAADVQIEEVTGGQTKRYNRSQFAARMKENYSRLPQGIKLTYRTQIDDIQLKGPQATVKTTVYERADYKGKTINATHTEITTLEKRQGAVLITKVRALVPAR